VDSEDRANGNLAANVLDGDPALRPYVLLAPHLGGTG